jgi:hypothetical protein
MQLTRQHFQLVADMLGDIINRCEMSGEHAALAARIAGDYLYGTNGAFDWGRFERAVETATGGNRANV